MLKVNRQTKTESKPDRRSVIDSIWFLIRHITCNRPTQFARDISDFQRGLLCFGAHHPRTNVAARARMAWHTRGPLRICITSVKVRGATPVEPQRYRVWTVAHSQPQIKLIKQNNNGRANVPRLFAVSPAKEITVITTKDKCAAFRPRVVRWPRQHAKKESTHVSCRSTIKNQ